MEKNEPLVNILFITFNRLCYTKISLPKLLSCSYKNYNVTIVDNGSTDGTVQYLKSLKDSKIENIIFNKKNEGLVKPTKKFWNTSNAKYVGKIDNDIVVPSNFINILIRAHNKINNLGVIGFCHFREEDINKKALKNKITSINNINIRVQPWIGGNYIMKREVALKYPYYRQSWKGFKKRILYGFNNYQQKLTDLNLINGYIADSKGDLFLWDHIDDPRNQNYLKDSNYNQRNMTDEEIIAWLKNDASELLIKY
ncbi:MAG: hypothetical protein CMG13_03480 [Candidatus Marinimicrobia bacterium]|nr:hypothetical protein [Candidatus Neomarinimicrobiota bacterium]|tara:strand:+ start:1926 stop:2687 length:762 start_codon:yes stop_codon:yes gene_type:complete